MPLGKGRVRFLGALLPDPTEDFYHPYGLQNYAVTYTGYTLLQNMLAHDNPARVDAPPAATQRTSGCRPRRAFSVKLPVPRRAVRRPCACRSPGRARSAPGPAAAG